MASSIEPIPKLVSELPLWQLREFYQTNALELTALFKLYINNEQWTCDHPDLALKSLAILEPQEQINTLNLKLYKIIGATLLQNPPDKIVNQVINDAIHHKNWDFILVLVQQGVVDPSHVILNGNTLLHEALDQENASAVEGLIKLGSAIDAIGCEGNTPLHVAAFRGNAPLVKLLIAEGAVIDILNHSLKTPLHHACNQPVDDLAALTLIEHGAEINLLDAWSTPPFFFAIESQKESLALIILEKVKDIDFRDTAHQTALHIACRNGCGALARRLLEKGAGHLNLQDEEGNTPLHYACKQRMTSIIEELLKRRADWKLRNKQKKMPFYTLLKHQEDTALQFFVKSIPDDDWMVAMFDQALVMGREEEADNLASLWKTNSDPWSILSKAILEPEISEYLIRAHKEWISGFRQQIILSKLNDRQKIGLLPLFPPDEIAELIGRVDVEDSFEWLDELVLVGENGVDSYLFESVAEGLQTVNREWLHYITWNDPDPLGYSRRLIVDLSEFINRIPLKSLAIAASNSVLQPILSKCIGVFSPDQLAVIIPQYDWNDFLNLSMQNDTVEQQAQLLHAATLKQKRKFLTALPLHHDEIIEDWIADDFQALHRELESLIEIKIRGGREIRTELGHLLKKLEEKKMSLQCAAQRNTYKLQSMKRAVLFNHTSPEFLALIKCKIDPYIFQSQNIKNQLERLISSIQHDCIFKLERVEEEEIPADFICGITQLPMTDPVTSHGHTFERSAIETWLSAHNVCPLCRKVVVIEDFSADNELQMRLQAGL